MKRCFWVLLLTVFAAGCKKELPTDQSEIKGTWQVYNYIVYNTSQTLEFQNLYSDYTITFDGAGNFKEFWHNSVDTFNTAGTYYFTNYFAELVLNEPIVDTINSVPHDTVYERQYNIFDLTGSSVQLRTDTSDIYLQKEQ